MPVLNPRNRTSSSSAVVGRRLNVIDRCREQATRTLASASPWTIRPQDSKEHKMSIADIGLTPDRSFMAALTPIRLEQPDASAKSARLKFLLDLSSGVASHLELDDLLKKVSLGARRVVPSDFALVGLLDSRTGQLNTSAFDFPDDDPLDQSACALLGKVIAERVFSPAELYGEGKKP